MPAGVSAYVPLANLTLGAAAATVTFSSISGSYRDLVLVFNGLHATLTTTMLTIRFNGDNTTNYNEVSIATDGTTATTNANAAAVGVRTLNTLSNTTINATTFNIMDYSATDKHKTVLVRSGNANSSTVALVSRWINTAAITSIAVQPTTATNMAAGCTFALYGVSA